MNLFCQNREIICVTIMVIFASMILLHDNLVRWLNVCNSATGKRWFLCRFERICQLRTKQSGLIENIDSKRRVIFMLCNISCRHVWKKVKQIKPRGFFALLSILSAAMEEQWINCSKTFWDLLIEVDFRFRSPLLKLAEMWRW